MTLEDLLYGIENQKYRQEHTYNLPKKLFKRYLRSIVSVDYKCKTFIKLNLGYKPKSEIDLSLVHLDWPDVYSDNNGVQTVGTLTGLTDGKWTEHTYTFVAKSKWIAIRTEGDASVYFDDFILYNTDVKGDEVMQGDSDATSPTNVWIVVIVAVLAVLVIGGAVTVVIVIKKRKK